MNMKFVFAFFAVASLAASSTFAAPGNKPRQQIEVDCDDLDRLDNEARIFGLFGDRAHKLPFTRAEAVDGHCPRMKNAAAVIKAYAKKCFKPFPQQVIGLLVYGSLKQTKARCDTEEAVETFVRHDQCQKNQPDEAHKCMDTYVKELEATRDTVTNLDLKIPYCCCGFHRMRKCIVKIASGYCAADSTNYLDEMLQKTVEDMTDLTCKNYETDSEGCENLPVLKLKAKQQAKSFLPPMVDIYTSL